MRFILALIAFLLGGILIAVGIAEQTVLKPADHITAQAKVPAGVNYVVLPASMLRTNEGSQTVKVSGSDTVWMAYGSSTDVRGWLAGSKYAQASLNASGQLQFKTASSPAPVGSDQAQLDPSGSDLWFSEKSAQGALTWPMNVPENTSVLVTADSGKGSLSNVSVRWPVRAETPLAGTMISLGAVLGILGALLLLWALLHVRSIQRGGGRGKRTGRARKITAAATALLVGVTGAAVGSSSADAAILSSASVTEQQAQRILARVTTVIAEADASRNTDLLETRMSGPSLQLREANYAIQAKDKTATTLQAIPQNGVTQLLLPESSKTWPRTMFAVVSDADGQSLPVALMLVQESARENYKLHYAVSLQAGAKIPNLPNAVTGTKQLALDDDSLQQQPEDVSNNYGLLLRDSASKAASLFSTDDDFLLASVGESAKSAAAKALGSTAKISFSDLAFEPSDAVVLATSDGSALVATRLRERWTVTPTKKGVTVKPSGATEILSKTPSTKKGIEAVYGYQLLFSVPLAKSKDKATLLGYSQGLIAATEVK